MSDISLDAYLFFDGNCRQAMEFYEDIFGGKLSVQTHGESPDTDPANKDKVMHAHLEGGDIKLFASDTIKKKLGTGKIELCLGGSDEAKLTEIFDALSAGGTVNMPLKKEFWGDTFGSLVDKYGVNWMMNIATKKT
ncbi:MAG: VOC family protein [Candidatus Saccharimonadales bacterium]